jgi:Ca2+-binding RTX toxin-like protein
MIFGGAGTRIGRNDPGQATGRDGRHHGLGVRARPRCRRDRRRQREHLPVRGRQRHTGGRRRHRVCLRVPDLQLRHLRGIKIIPRAVELLDYTPGGPDYDAAALHDIGAGDEIHGEGGDDFIYGMVGDDVLFGDGQDDDLIGGYGNDWISGGTGQDGILGDDGRIFTSRNGLTEPLNGVLTANVAADDQHAGEHAGRRLFTSPASS